MTGRTDSDSTGADDASRTSQLDAFGTRVRDLRKAANLTQAELATAIGVARTTMVYIEMGRHEVGVSRAFALAKALGVHPSTLFL